jgi:hypothetical protein
MAMFNILASVDDTEFFDDALRSLIEIPRTIISVFPVISTSLQTFDGIGITASGKDLDRLIQVKEELLMILDFFWQKNFSIRELYHGRIVTRETFKSDLDYFWNLPHKL